MQIVFGKDAAKTDGLGKGIRCKLLAQSIVYGMEARSLKVPTTQGPVTEAMRESCWPADYAGPRFMFVQDRADRMQRDAGIGFESQLAPNWGKTTRARLELLTSIEASTK